jgi:hypothetical protein
MKEFLKRHSLILGLLLMFLFTWPIDLSNSRVLPFQVPFVIYVFLEKNQNRISSFCPINAI